jgi:hypothetical protein
MVEINVQCKNSVYVTENTPHATSARMACRWCFTEQRQVRSLEPRHEYGRVLDRVGGSACSG